MATVTITNLQNTLMSLNLDSKAAAAAAGTTPDIHSENTKVIAAQSDTKRPSHEDNNSASSQSPPATVTLDYSVIKHPLENAWTLWFYKNDKACGWKENQVRITTVATVEDFWSVFNHLEVASRLPLGSDYSLFKQGIFPDWEDKRNQNGGRWIISLDKRQRSLHLDNYWQEILFFLIGEQADTNAHQVNGAVVNIRPRADKLAVWLADASEPDSLMNIGRQLKSQLGMDREDRMGFSVHKEEKAPRGGSQRKQQMYV